MTVQQDRRDARARRIPFEALVEIGGDGTPAFEAESVDVSTGGMHLRSAYLPEIGQPIVCRFDTGAGEPICAEGQVVWRDDGELGGELGIQFTNVDEPSAVALLEMCGVPPADIEPAPMASAASVDPQPGSRVRLHIDGLGAPMKARVRTIGDKQLLVGTNLDFLRLGRALEIEAADPHEKRPAQVGRVSIDIDPASKVPQLVVELRYSDVTDDAPAVAPRQLVEQAMQAAPLAPAPVEELEEIEEAEAQPEEPAPTFRARRPVEVEEEPRPADELELASGMKDGLSRAAMRMGPALAQVGSRAKTTIELLFAKSRGEQAPTDDFAASPRRTTAPPPSGALQALGRRIVREEEPSASAHPVATKKRTRAIALGGAAGIASVLLLMALRSPSSSEAGPTAGELAAMAESAPLLPEVSDDTVVATVPLFGPMPLSTIKPPAPEAPSVEAELPQEPAHAASARNLAALDQDPFEEEALAAEPVRSAPAPKPREATKAPAAEKKAPKVAAFTHGAVKNGKTLRLRMDDAITSLRGTRSPDGFSVFLPARKAKEKAGPLASRDERILQSRILNGPKGAELTIRFKDAVPAYAVRAEGEHLVIELAGAKKSKPSATAKKGSVGKKN